MTATREALLLGITKGIARALAQWTEGTGMTFHFTADAPGLTVASAYSLPHELFPLAGAVLTSTRWKLCKLYFSFNMAASTATGSGVLAMRRVPTGTSDENNL